MYLTDIAIEHVYRGKKAPQPVTFVMHPFLNDTGPSKGRFEVIGNLPGVGVTPKRSIHVTEEQLAELYARGLIESLSLRLRLRPSEGSYPDAPPGKKVPRSCVRPGSRFDQQIQAVDCAGAITEPLKNILESAFGRLAR